MLPTQGQGPSRDQGHLLQKERIFLLDCHKKTDCWTTPSFKTPEQNKFD